jgi:hypothetical protein
VRRLADPVEIVNAPERMSTPATLFSTRELAPRSSKVRQQILRVIAPQSHTSVWKARPNQSCLPRRQQRTKTREMAPPLRGTPNRIDSAVSPIDRQIFGGKSCAQKGHGRTGPTEDHLGLGEVGDLGSLGAPSVIARIPEPVHNLPYDGGQDANTRTDESDRGRLYKASSQRPFNWCAGMRTDMLPDTTSSC